MKYVIAWRVTPRTVDRVLRAVLGWDQDTTPLVGAAES